MLCLPETAFVPDHDNSVNVPIHLTLAKAVELDYIFTTDIHPSTILSVEMERTIGAVSVVPGLLEIDAQAVMPLLRFPWRHNKQMKYQLPVLDIFFEYCLVFKSKIIYVYFRICRAKPLHNSTNAGVVKLVDARDSKSRGLCVRVGSIPTSGTKKYQGVS